MEQISWEEAMNETAQRLGAVQRERGRGREKPNAVLEERRQEQTTNGASDTQTRSQERTTQPNP